MTNRKKIKYVHEGRYVAEVEVSLIEDATGWSPYLSVDDAARLDRVREDLRAGRIEAAGRIGRVYELKPVAP
jgi:hypothetical protein